MDGQAQSQRLELEVLAVLPQERFARDALFAPLALLEAAEDYRDGRAVAAYGWPGKAGETPRARIYPGFRLYARDLDAVEGLRRHFVASGVEVATQAEAIAQVRSLSRNLGLVFWIVAALAIGGAFAAIAASSLAAVERKRRALAVLRLLGFPTAALVGFVMLLALFSAVFGLFLAGLLYAATAGALNHLFDNQSGEFVCRLLPSHYLTALLATLLCSVWPPPAAAGARRGSKPQRDYAMFEKAILPLALGACLAFAAPAWAEGDSPDNPKPLADDVALPLPCGGEMVFRHVYVLAEGALDDREVNLGYAFNEGEAGYQQSFISGYRRDYVNGQFSLADLAPAWQQKLSASLPKPAAGTR